MNGSIKWIGTAPGIAIQGLTLTALITTLLIMRYVSEATWAQLVQWLWGSYIAGAALSAYRDIRKPPQ